MTAVTKGSVAAARSFLALFLAASSSSRISGSMPLVRWAFTKVSPVGVRITSSAGTSRTLPWKSSLSYQINEACTVPVVRDLMSDMLQCPMSHRQSAFSAPARAALQRQTVMLHAFKRATVLCLSTSSCCLLLVAWIARAFNSSWRCAVKALISGTSSTRERVVHRHA